MTIDIRKIVKAFDEQFGSNVQRHEKKVAAIPRALKSGEDVAFATDVKMFGSFRDDIIVVTDSRLLVLRKDGKRIDALDLEDVVALTLEPRTEIGSLLTIILLSDNVPADWQAHIRSETAAVALTNRLYEVSSALRANRSREEPILTLPAYAPDDSAIWQVVNAFDREHGSSVARHREKVLSIPRALHPEEVIALITDGRFDDAWRDDLFVVTDSRILAIRQNGQDIPHFDVAQIRSVTQGETTKAGTEVDIVFEDIEWRVYVHSTGAAAEFVSALQAMLDREEGATPSKPNRPEEAPADRQATVGMVEGTESTEYQPIAIHGLSPEDIAGVYDQLAAEIVDFSALTKWQLSHLPEVMLPGELLIWLASGYLRGSFKDPGDSGGTMIAITDRRLLLLVDPWLATKQHKAFRLTDISAVHRDGGFITGGFRFRESGGGQRKIASMAQSSAEVTVAKLQLAIDTALSPPPTPLQPLQVPQAGNPDVADQLEKLASLVERGFLTPEEFAEQKAKLLSG